MATHEEIHDSLVAFCEGYNSNEKLKAMNRDWDRTVLVRATDVVSEHTLTLQGGDLTLSEGAPQTTPHLTVLGDSETLVDLFYGDITPTEPYLKGSLKVRGEEDDVLRLDFISLMIWGE